jgi:hypothetical protein
MNTTSWLFNINTVAQKLLIITAHSTLLALEYYCLLDIIAF